MNTKSIIAEYVDITTKNYNKPLSLKEHFAQAIIALQSSPLVSSQILESTQIQELTKQALNIFVWEVLKQSQEVTK